MKALLLFLLISGSVFAEDNEFGQKETYLTDSDCSSNPIDDSAGRSVIEGKESVIIDPSTGKPVKSQ